MESCVRKQPGELFLARLRSDSFGNKKKRKAFLQQYPENTATERSDLMIEFDEYRLSLIGMEKAIMDLRDSL